MIRQGDDLASERLTVVRAPAGSAEVLTAYLFDTYRGVKVDAWPDSFRGLGRNELLWVDMTAPSAEELSEACEVFGVRPNLESDERAARPRLVQEGGCLTVTAVAVSDSDRDPLTERVIVDCFLGANWILTVHRAEIAVIHDFRETASGEGELGALDAPSFLADLLEWVVASYLRAFDEIEAELEKFDVESLTTTSRNPAAQIKQLVEARQRVGRLRRSLAPHRDVFAALSHSEFDLLSSESSSQRFIALTARLDAALNSARDVKDAIASSFDVLIVRTEHRTNEIVKVLTLVSILLLPGALLAGIAGMNVNFKLSVFVNSALFWLVLAGVIAIAATSVIIARTREWI